MYTQILVELELGAYRSGGNRLPPLWTGSRVRHRQRTGCCLPRGRSRGRPEGEAYRRRTADRRRGIDVEPRGRRAVTFRCSVACGDSRVSGCCARARFVSCTSLVRLLLQNTRVPFSFLPLLGVCAGEDGLSVQSRLRCSVCSAARGLGARCTTRCWCCCSRPFPDAHPA